MLHEGRQKLRQKFRAVREDLRVAQNQVRAVESSRAIWRARAEIAEEELRLSKKRADNPEPAAFDAGQRFSAASPDQS